MVSHSSSSESHKREKLRYVFHWVSREYRSIHVCIYMVVDVHVFLLDVLSMMLSYATIRVCSRNLSYVVSSRVNRH